MGWIVAKLTQLNEFVASAIRNPWVVITFLFGALVSLFYQLFDWVTGFLIDIAIDQFPDLPSELDENLFQYFATLTHARAFAQMLIAYLGVYLTCYFTHFLGIPISYIVKFIRIR